MFDWVKKRVLGRKKRDVDYDDVRSHVLGEDPFGSDLDTPQPEPPMMDDLSGQRLAPPERPLPMERPSPMDRPRRMESFDQPRSFDAPQRGFESRDRMDTSHYEIVDRLKFIESQLAAIKSQTETINERLKNLETRRRY